MKRTSVNDAVNRNSPISETSRSEPKRDVQVHFERPLEFGGTIGAAFMVAGLPLAIWGINIVCNKSSCSLGDLRSIVLPNWSELFDIKAALLYISWFVFQLVLSVLPCGTVAFGLPLKASGTRLRYRCNGFISFVISILLFLILFYLGVPVTYVYDRFLAILTAAILFSFSLAIYLYARSWTRHISELAEGGQSGSVIYDFFIGRELNPRIGPVDLKFFCELRPGLIGWVILDLCFVVQAWQTTGVQPLSALSLVVFFHTLYVADALWHEEAILTTMDIVHDGFGLMLALGDLAWVPFLYTLQARYILEHPQQWNSAALLAILALNIIGFVIFRRSNSEKNDFRQNPENPKLKHLKTLLTQSGSRLLITGWWGICRHPNYMGDLIMALSWSLVTGFDSILPYFYPIYFLGLLVHRSLRDEANCRHKYGTDWDRYCQLVPYRIFPYIY